MEQETKKMLLRYAQLILKKEQGKEMTPEELAEIEKIKSDLGKSHEEILQTAAGIFK